MKNDFVFIRKSHGRFNADSPPDFPFRQQPLAWLFWLVRMLGYHLPVRIAILPGELPEHDYHHRHPHSKDWANGIYARQQDLEAGCPGWCESYTEVWGLFEATDRVFETLSKAPNIPKQ